MLLYCFSVSTRVVWAGDETDRTPLGGAAGQQLLKHELEKPVYQEHHSVFRRVIEKLVELFSAKHFNPHLPSLNWIIVAIVLVVLVLGITLLLTNGSWRGHHVKSGQKTADSVVFEDNRGAIQYLAAAKAALGREDFATAFLEQFRHLLMAGANQGAITITPGMTACEGSRKLTQAATNFASELDWAATMFNASRFGHYQVSHENYLRLHALDQALEQQFKNHPPQSHPARAPIPSKTANATSLISAPPRATSDTTTTPALHAGGRL